MKMRVCVFGSSSARTSTRIMESAFELGKAISERGHVCVNGAGFAGCMRAVNNGSRSVNGDIIGVIHTKWCVDGQEDELIKNMVIFI
jgi:predicted Rossmann-fold nucleotide-binding protein